MSSGDIIIISLGLFDLHHAQIGWRTMRQFGWVRRRRRVVRQTKQSFTWSLVNILSIGFLEPWRLSGPSAATLLHHRKPL